jgi:opacity protein-like surface antigen
MRRFLLAAVMFGAGSVAQAADMPDLPILRGAFTEGLTTSRVNWQGVYIGGQAAYGSINSKPASSLNSDMQATFIPPAGLSYNWPSLAVAHGSNSGFGGFVGYNSQWDDVVVGIEGNYLHGGLHAATSGVGNTYFNNFSLATTTNSNALISLTDFGSVRLRAAYAIGCFLPYLYGGAGVGSQTVERNVSASPAPMLVPWSSDTKTKFVYGYSLGAGVDVMLMAGLFLRAEYEYLRVTSRIESNVNSARIGIGYKF